eukprot:661489-Pyramimonas_sp.AAC.1
MEKNSNSPVEDLFIRAKAREAEKMMKAFYDNQEFLKKIYDSDADGSLKEERGKFAHAFDRCWTVMIDALVIKSRTPLKKLNDLIAEVTTKIGKIPKESDEAAFTKYLSAKATSSQKVADMQKSLEKATADVSGVLKRCGHESLGCKVAGHDETKSSAEKLVEMMKGHAAELFCI